MSIFVGAYYLVRELNIELASSGLAQDEQPYEGIPSRG